MRLYLYSKHIHEEKPKTEFESFNYYNQVDGAQVAQAGLVSEDLESGTNHLWLPHSGSITVPARLRVISQDKQKQSCQGVQTDGSSSPPPWGGGDSVLLPCR